MARPTRQLPVSVVLIALLGACGPDPAQPPTDGGTDAEGDSVSPDADGGLDAGTDAERDAQDTGPLDTDRPDASSDTVGDADADAPDQADTQHTDTDDTTPDAPPAVCGDGVVQPGEHCDDGDRLDGDGCDAMCRVPRCVPGADADGDGIDDCDDVERCDGIDNNGDGLVDNRVQDDLLGTACDDAPEAGECRSGRVACRGGELVCVGQIGPRDELCNGLDDDCDGEVPAREAGCGPWAGAIPAGGLAVQSSFALPTQPLDVALHVDSTTSMSATLAQLVALADDGAPWRWAPEGDVAWALVAHEDFPVPGRSDPRAMPHRLLSRVTTSRAALSQALAMLSPRSGGDAAEPWDLSLWRVATGDTIRATLVASTSTAALPPQTPARVTEAAVDFALPLVSGGRVVLDVYANRIGLAADTELAVLDRDGRELARADDAVRLDPTLELTLRAGDYTVRVSGCCGAEDEVAGLAVTVDGAPWIADPVAICEDPRAVRELAPLDTVWPVASPACAARCADLGPSWLIEAFCGAGLGAGTCGDGRLDWGEDCDDGNRNPADGCDGACRFESFLMARWLPGVGYSDGLGHGELGGVGFREGAERLVLHLGDASAVRSPGGLSPNLVAPHRSFATTLPGVLGNAGIAVAGVWTGAGPEGLAELRSLAAATGAWAPACAFDGTAPRLGDACGADACCTGPGGAGTPTQEGRCPLILEKDADEDLDAALALALALARGWRTQDVVLRLEPARACALGALRASVESPLCESGATVEDTDGDGIDETIRGLRSAEVIALRATLRGADEERPEGCVDTDVIEVIASTTAGDLTRIPLLVVP